MIDAKGHYVTPEFIDMHVHGGGGHDFSDGTVEAFVGAAEMHARHGTTSMVPTTLTGTLEELQGTIDAYELAKHTNGSGAYLLGLHIEGPYLAMNQRGAQDAKYIRDPDPEEYRKILGWTEDIIRWSAAPELKGALEFGRELRKRGILVSSAHTDAVYDEALEAFENGFTHMTHFYSGMSGVTRGADLHRHAGVVESAFIIDETTIELIADGDHLPASLLKLVYQIKGPSRTILVTDAMRAAGMPEGESILGSLKNGQKVIVEDGVAKLIDRTSFAGSVATTDRLVRTMVTLAGIPLIDAIRMMTSTPASIIGVDRYKGSLVPDKDADIVMFDDTINIQMTIVKGKIVYSQMKGCETYESDRVLR